MAGTESLVVPLETVTPLFLAGAEPRGAPELRAPAFRGALRYWLRAALGGVLGDNLEAVRREEAAVFGSTDERAGGAGAVTVRIRHGELPSPEPYERAGTAAQPAGRDYLYWSMVAMGGNEAKHYYPPGASFTLALATRPGARAAEPALQQAAAALWLLVQCGGVGSRSRRTAGSLSAAESAQASGLRFNLAGRTPATVADELGQGIKRVREIVSGGRSPAALPVFPGFDILHPTTCRMWVLGRWERASSAVDDVGAKFRGFRIGDRRGGRTAPSLMERAVFGLPLRGLDIQPPHGWPAIDRRASPLWLKVSGTTDGGAVVVATLFRCRFLPNGATLARAGREEPPPANYDLIERWIRTAFPTAQEVRHG
jgi:CRISPR-associated protein Cmr1